MSEPSMSLFGELEEDVSTVALPEVKRKVVFFPFEERKELYWGFYEYPNSFAGQSDVNPVKSWRNIVASVYASDSDQKKTTTLGLLSSQKDTLYIMGQCTAGLDCLYSLNQKDKVDAAAIVDLLKPYLKTGFAGKFKVYACNSATGGGESGGDPFAKRLAVAMRAAGYTKCRYFGYNAQVSGFATKDYKGDANLKDATGQHKWALSGPDAGKRASASRVEILIE